MRLKRAFQLLVDHGLIGGACPAKRPWKHQPQGPPRRHAQQRRVRHEERTKVIRPGHRREIQQHYVPARIDPNGEGPREGVGEVGRVFCCRVDGTFG